MKYLVVLVLVLGFACAREEEELGLQSLLSFEDELSSYAKMLPSFVNARNSKAMINQIQPDLFENGQIIVKTVMEKEGTMATMRAVDKVINIKALVDGIVSSLAGIAIPILELVNGIMALIGLVKLIIYLIEGGDIKALAGVGRSLNSWEWSSFAFNPDSHTVDKISKVFFQAMDKYENML